jgi:hypothetical protein
MANRLKDLTGRRFKQLTVLELAHKEERAHWLCECDCGNKIVVAGNHLQKANGTASCGCARETHGYSKPGSVHPLYRVWLSMRERCNNPKSSHYKWYGARGITVCAEWDDFEAFKRDMGERPEGRSLDRKDNNGPYSKDNCRWATKQEQIWNTSKARWIEFNGQRKVLSEWARHFSVTPSHVYAMCRKYGEQAGLDKLMRR